MKRKFTKGLALTLTLALLFALSLTASAAELTREQAIAVALQDANYTEADTLYLKAEPDYDDGVKYYDVDFTVVLEENVVGEYEYEVRASDGKILSKDKEVEARRGVAPVSASAAIVNVANEVTLEKAKEIALQEFGFEQSQVQFLKARKDYDDGRAVYEIKFRNGTEAKYSCEIDVATGAVRDRDVEFVRDFEDKIELLFEIIIAWLFVR